MMMYQDRNAEYQVWGKHGEHDSFQFGYDTIVEAWETMESMNRFPPTDMDGNRWEFYLVVKLHNPVEALGLNDVVEV